MYEIPFKNNNRSDMKVYHGTNSETTFSQLIPNHLGIVWFTEDYTAAKRYGNKYYNKGKTRVFTVNIHGRVLDFRDKDHPIIKQYIQEIKSSFLFDIESSWERYAAFDVLEQFHYIIDVVKQAGYSGLLVLDETYSYEHESIAYFDENYVIESIEDLLV